MFHRLLHQLAQQQHAPQRNLRLIEIGINFDRSLQLLNSLFKIFSTTLYSQNPQAQVTFGGMRLSRDQGAIGISAAAASPAPSSVVARKNMALASPGLSFRAARKAFTAAAESPTPYNARPSVNSASKCSGAKTASLYNFQSLSISAAGSENHRQQHQRISAPHSLCKRCSFCDGPIGRSGQNFCCRTCERFSFRCPTQIE